MKPGMSFTALDITVAMEPVSVPGPAPRALDPLPVLNPLVKLNLTDEPRALFALEPDPLEVLDPLAALGPDPDPRVPQGLLFAREPRLLAPLVVTDPLAPDPDPELPVTQGPRYTLADVSEAWSSSIAVDVQLPADDPLRAGSIPPPRPGRLRPLVPRLGFSS
jgi:hypothetical protein